MCVHARLCVRETLCSKYIFNLTATRRVSAFFFIATLLPFFFPPGFMDLGGEKDISDIIKSALGDFLQAQRDRLKRLTRASIYIRGWKQLQQSFRNLVFTSLYSREQAGEGCSSSKFTVHVYRRSEIRNMG